MNLTPEQELEQLKRAGRKMRAAQKEYFDPKTRNSRSLITAKSLERDFDKLIGEEKSNQFNLF